MSVIEIIDSLGVEADAESIEEFDEQLIAANEIATLGGATTKLALWADGRVIHAMFSSGFSAIGQVNTSGSGAFAGSELDLEPFVHYMLEVGSNTAELYQGSNLIWTGTGRQRGITGSWRITLKPS